MSTRRYKGPPESLAFIALKLLCSVVAIVVVLGLYFVPLAWCFMALKSPEWTVYVFVAVWLALSAITYTGIKLSTPLGRFLCDWPRYY
jgi:hypothetical protein